ncbi:MAG: Plasmid pRiA4b ORF-3-like protein [Schlesneria sp.]|nr:Plasmid pRiA4b ORF-3-like protein [Schlesneria sp.]
MKQRESLIQGTRIKKGIKDRLQEAGAGTRVIEVTRKELDHVSDEIEASIDDAVGAEKRNLVAVLRRILELPSVGLDGSLSDTSSKAPKSALKSNVVYQFKITILEIKPAIWRRIQILDCTLGDLHRYIQAAFGWENYHMHEFKIDGVSYTQPLSDAGMFGMESEDETEAYLSKLIPKSNRKPLWDYIYDFGDDWGHQIQFEGFLPVDPKVKYPSCVDGKRACPPEDCGGPWATSICWMLSAILNMKTTKNCWSGAGQSTPKPSILRRRQQS